MEMLNNSRKLAFPKMTLCTLFVSVLAACGGGNTASDAAADLATVAATDSSSTSAATTAEALRVKQTPVSKTTLLAQERASFSVVGTQTVKYGADTRWIQKSVTGNGLCINDFFGGDPAVGVVKSCQLVPSMLVAEPAPTVAPAPMPAPEPAPVPAPAPAPAAASPAPSGPAVTAWVRLATENESFSTTGTQTIRFGDGRRWVSKTVSSAATCSVGFFGSDPAYGSSKYCEVQLTVPGVVQTGDLPVVNTALIPKAGSAYNTARVRALSVAELLNSWALPTLSDIGNFRVPCNFSHMAADDPIVFPNKPGASHMHTFFGNSLASASSTSTSLMNTGDSTCAGGTLNRTAYWMPTLIDVRTGQPLAAGGGNFYYKQGYLGVKSGSIQAFPKGLRMIAGDSGNSSPLGSSFVRIECANGGGKQPSIPSCPVGDTLVFTVVFPQCWDGVNLDSPDHKSHMAYATGGGCPTTHPVPLAEVTLNVGYPVTEANSAAFWRLSSDSNSLPGGYSLHADWFSGWDTATNQAFLNGCVNKNMDCHDYLLGDGRMLY